MDGLNLELAGVKTVMDFEVMEIMDEKYPYPALLVI
jgi:hypothetical protein